jgi:hypothetical protein
MLKEDTEGGKVEYYSGFNIKIWKLSTPPRSDFVEFLGDTPWGKKTTPVSKRGSSSQVI